MTVSQVEAWFVSRNYATLTSPEKFTKWHAEGLNEVDPPPPPEQELMTANQVYAYIADAYPN